MLEGGVILVLIIVLINVRLTIGGYMKRNNNKESISYQFAKLVAFLLVGGILMLILNLLVVIVQFVSPYYL